MRARILPSISSHRLRAMAMLGSVMLALYAASLLAEAVVLAPTPSETEGPFYPRTLPADRDNDLTQVEGQPRSAQGTRLYLSGRVLAPDGRPMAGAIVELWQCDTFGRYHHVGDDGQPRDDGFQGYGTMTTDADGRFSFKTIRPVAYGGRVPHMHFKIRTASGTLTTQLYVKGDPTKGDPVLAMSSPADLDRLTVALAPAAGREPGALAATFDFVVRQR